MSTAVAGLVKIGKTGSSNYAERMRFLEGNGYANVTGLKREFAIEVEDYDAKETLIDEIFAKARVGTSELFALDVDLAKQLLAAFEGTQIYPSTARESKEEVFTALSTGTASTRKCSAFLTAPISLTTLRADRNKVFMCSCMLRMAC